MPRGHAYADLAAALKAIIERDTTLTPYRIHLEIVHNIEKYEAPEAFSITAVQHAIAGHPISARTRDTMTAFVRTVDPTLLPLKPREADLDVGTFFYTRGPKLPKAGTAIHGDYQTFARSTTAEGYLRLGQISFRYDTKAWRLHMHEMQYRPEIDGHRAATMRWQGFATQKTDYYFALLRTLGDAQDATPMFYALRPLLRDPDTQRILTLRGKAMHYEAERGSLMYPDVFLTRMPAPDIQLDFIPMDTVTNAVVRMELGLGPRIPGKRKRDIAGSH